MQRRTQSLPGTVSLPMGTAAREAEEGEGAAEIPIPERVGPSRSRSSGAEGAVIAPSTPPGAIDALSAPAPARAGAGDPP